MKNEYTLILQISRLEAFKDDRSKEIERSLLTTKEMMKMTPSLKASLHNSI
ncbi:hypothetical protein ACET9H_20890 [Aeromonas media]